jgi:hypothetical protein
VERSDEEGDSNDDWDRFLGWLAVPENQASVGKIMGKHDLVLRDWYEAFQESFHSIPSGDWRVTSADGATTECAHGYLLDFLRGVDADRWINLVIWKTVDRATALGRGPAIAGDIAELFRDLMPLYHAAAGR